METTTLVTFSSGQMSLPEAGGTRVLGVTRAAELEGVGVIGVGVIGEGVLGVNVNPPLAPPVAKRGIRKGGAKTLNLKKFLSFSFTI